MEQFLHFLVSKLCLFNYNTHLESGTSTSFYAGGLSQRGIIVKEAKFLYTYYLISIILNLIYTKMENYQFKIQFLD
jgi:hypothetical protein